MSNGRKDTARYKRIFIGIFDNQHSILAPENPIGGVVMVGMEPEDSWLGDFKLVKEGAAGYKTIDNRSSDNFALRHFRAIRIVFQLDAVPMDTGCGWIRQVIDQTDDQSIAYI
ncbi:MAG: hypothetical protein ABI691_15290 [Ginsengibacter sp.]